MREVARWVFRSVIVTGILGLLLSVLFFILASQDANSMTGAEFAVGIPMVFLWLYFWTALVVGIILKLLSRERDGK